MITPRPVLPLAAIPVSQARPSPKLAILSLSLALLAHALPAHFVLSMCRIPPGTAIRPMAEAFMLFVGTAIGAGAVVPAVITIIRREYRGMACLAFVLALTPAFVWDFMMDWVIARQGLVLKP